MSVLGQGTKIRKPRDRKKKKDPCNSVNKYFPRD